MPLVLSLFPGIGLLDRAFEEEGFTVVRGPDLLWGGDVRTFHPPADVFEGVIGGPPCQRFSTLSNLVKARGFRLAPNLIPEFERCIAEARPRWFLMENVPRAPVPVVDGYGVDSFILDNRWIGGVQQRRRRLSFGVPGAAVALWRHVDLVALEAADWHAAVLAGDGGTRFFSRSWDPKTQTYRPRTRYQRVTLDDLCRLQGLPPDFHQHLPFRREGKCTAIGNGVPIPMGRALAAAVRSWKAAQDLGGQAQAVA